MAISAISKSAINKEVAIAEVRKWFHHIMESKGWNGSELARRSGVAASTILRMDSDKNYNFMTSLTTIGAVASASGFKPPKSLIEAYGVKNEGFETNLSPPSQIESGTATARILLGRGRNLEAPKAEPVVRSRLRVRNILSFPKQFHFLSESDIFVETPPRLENDPTAFAYHLKETSLEPAVQHGSLMYASKGRDPVPGDTVLITKEDGVSMTRIFVDHNENGVVVMKRLDPADTITIPMDKIDEISVVVLKETI